MVQYFATRPVSAKPAIELPTEARYCVLRLARRLCGESPRCDEGYFNTSAGVRQAMDLRRDACVDAGVFVNFGVLRKSASAARPPTGAALRYRRAFTGARPNERGEKGPMAGASRPAPRRRRTLDHVDRRLDAARRRPSGQADTVRIARRTILMSGLPASVLAALQDGRVIPAHPLALHEDGRFDEQRQRALSRYYAAAGSGGLAVGVHTTQFAIRDPAVGLFEPVLAIAAEEMDRVDAHRAEPLIRIGGICGTRIVPGRGSLLGALGYMRLQACRDGRATMMRALPIAWTRRPAFRSSASTASSAAPARVYAFGAIREIPAVVAIKIAPFTAISHRRIRRYDAGARRHSPLTGNDVPRPDWLRLPVIRRRTHRRARMSGGSWQWAVGHGVPCRCWARAGGEGDGRNGALLPTRGRGHRRNAAFFDAATARRPPDAFRMCCAAGAVSQRTCMSETTSSPRHAEIDRVCRDYPNLRETRSSDHRMSARMLRPLPSSAGAAWAVASSKKNAPQRTSVELNAKV